MSISFVAAPRAAATALASVWRRRDQDMRRLEKIGGAEVRKIVVVKAAAVFLVGLILRRLAFDQGADQRFLVGFAAALLVAGRFGLQVKAPRLLQQQFADRQRPRGLREGVRRACRAMVLRLLRDLRMCNGDAIDADAFSHREFGGVGGAGAHTSCSVASALRLRTI